jgi:hypothetical protein
MALADTSRAIGAITDGISLRLKARTTLDVTVGRPEPAPNEAGKRLNIFLYEAHFDANLKNVPLDEGQRPPLWLVLKYLMTAFDDLNNSDSVQAFEYLGQGISALQELTLFPLTPGLTADIVDALGDNPEDLKITFDDAPSDLLSKIMQGSDEKYRLSVGFQVRPVMIVAPELPSYSLLVGIDYSTPPAVIIGEAGIKIPVIPSMGPTITEISPASFQLGSTVTIKGTDLHLSSLSVSIGPVELPVTMQQPDQLQFEVREDLVNGSTISAGGLAVSVTQLLSTGRRRSSNVLVGNLSPDISTVAVVGPILHPNAPPPPITWNFATIELSGKLLGTNGDDFYLALYRDGKTFAMLDDPKNDVSPVSAPQTIRQFKMIKEDAVPPGKYLVLYRVNGQQARQTLELDLT